MVDAAEQQVGFFAQDFIDGKLDAINRCARGLPGRLYAFNAKCNRLHFQNAIDGHGVAHAALSAVGRYDNHIAVLNHGAGQGLNALGLDAVVIGDEDEGARGFCAHALFGIRCSASKKKPQNFWTELIWTHSSGLWAPRMLGPKLTMSISG